MTFSEAVHAFYEPLGPAHHMVLATADDARVSARMMSVIQLDGRFYFQTDVTLRKHAQLQRNPRAALCADCLQVEGACRLLGRPMAHEPFRAAFERAFPSACARYTALENEVLYVLEPDFAQKWIYQGGQPFVERLDYAAQAYEKRPYLGR